MSRLKSTSKAGQEIIDRVDTDMLYQYKCILEVDKDSLRMGHDLVGLLAQYVETSAKVFALMLSLKKATEEQKDKLVSMVVQQFTMEMETAKMVSEELKGVYTKSEPTGGSDDE